MSICSIMVKTLRKLKKTKRNNKILMMTNRRSLNKMRVGRYKSHQISIRLGLKPIASLFKSKNRKTDTLEVRLYKNAQKY